MSKEEEIKHLKVLPERILKGFRLLFICLTIGVITEGAISWKWIEHLITAVIFGMTVILIVIVRKIEKKREREEYEKQRKEGK